MLSQKKFSENLMYSGIYYQITRPSSSNNSEALEELRLEHLSRSLAHALFYNLHYSKTLRTDMCIFSHYFILSGCYSMKFDSSTCCSQHGQP